MASENRDEEPKAKVEDKRLPERKVTERVDIDEFIQKVEVEDTP